MRSHTRAILAAALLISGSSVAFGATNFTQLSNEELSALKSSMKYESDDTREAFRKEWEKRVAAMTPAEREKLARPSTDSTSQDEADCP